MIFSRIYQAVRRVVRRGQVAYRKRSRHYRRNR